MNYFQALIFAIVEGITEFLPISSTGHLILTAHLLGITHTEFVKSFEIIIQLGAIAAVLFLYWDKLTTSIKIAEKVFIAFIPTAVIGLLFYKIVKEFLLGNTYVTLLSLFIGGIALIGLELIYKEKEHHADSIAHLTKKQAFFIGVIQSVSLIPGVSRAAATIIGALFLGAKRKTAVEFSFLLAVPTMCAAVTLDIIKTNITYSQEEIILLLIGFVGSFFVALCAIKFLLQFIKTNTFIPFGIYRILVAIIFWFFMIQ